MISSKLPYLGLIVAGIMFFYGILNLFASIVPLIIMGIPYGLTPIYLILIQNMISGIILVTPGCIVYWKSNRFRELLKK